MFIKMPLVGVQALLSALLLLTLASTPSHSFWIMSHKPLNFNARLDAIVSPGNVSSHLHSFVGSNAISNSQTYNSLRSSSACTTSGVDADKSSYWTPTLFKYSNNEFTAFNLSYVQTYYLQRGKGKLSAFPKGLRMVAGDATARGPANTTQLQKVVNFVCLDYKKSSPETSTIPDGPCPDGFRAQIVFPSCWDGVNLDSSDHKSHMSYPLGDNADNGDECPSSHPKRLITLFYEFIYSVGSAANAGTWTLANGDMKGYSFHGDFMNGWDVDVLQSAIDQCTTNLFNNLEGCPPFAATLDRKGSQSCEVDPSKVKGLSSETVSGALDKLPGCNTIFNGALSGKGGCSASSSSSSSSSSSQPTFTSSSVSTGHHSSKASATTTGRNNDANTTPSTSKKHHHSKPTAHHRKHKGTHKKHKTHKHKHHHNNRRASVDSELS